MEQINQLKCGQIFKTKVVDTVELQSSLPQLPHSVEHNILLILSQNILLIAAFSLFPQSSVLIIFQINYYN